MEDDPAGQGLFGDCPWSLVGTRFTELYSIPKRTVPGLSGGVKREG